MTAIECPNACKVHWQATGAIHVSRRHLQRAVLFCPSCRKVFTSGLPEALEAAQAVTPDQRIERPESVPVPSSQDFVSVGGVAKWWE